MSERSFVIDGVKFMGGSGMEARLRALHEGAKASKTPASEEAASAVVIEEIGPVEVVAEEAVAELVPESHHTAQRRKHRA